MITNDRGRCDRENVHEYRACTGNKAVCQIIEEYGDESLLSEYRCELFNKREIFSPSAGRAEKDIAEGYKDNAEFLSIKYPKTADVFFKMSQSYVYDSDLERRRAENGYF